MNKYFDLTGMLAVITGGRRGIGLAIARSLGRKRRPGDHLRPQHLPTQGIPE
jgi:hypothetical protein